VRFVVSKGILGVLDHDQMFPVDADLGEDPIRGALEQDVDLNELAESALAAGNPRSLPQRLDPPIRTPSKILAVGLNYMDHCRESGTPVPDHPIEFAKYPSSLTGHMHPIPLDEQLSDQVDYEVELAAVIGIECRDLEVTTALNTVAGYTIANDVSARDLQTQDGQWVRGKSLDGFCPLGPYFVTVDEVPDPQSLALRTWLDGSLLQDSSTNEMVFSVAQLLVHVSQHKTLSPGDVLLTGTPYGTGAYREPPIYMKAGSTVECSVEGLGTLTNPIVSY
jgi:2-keto-4-pentenoate hydratase/2-oxohepta-3-ene-1,7-dioic acid hydratase in catechol pathway